MRLAQTCEYCNQEMSLVKSKVNIVTGKAYLFFRCQCGAEVRANWRPGERVKE
jgi:hypothetical protein